MKKYFTLMLCIMSYFAVAQEVLVEGYTYQEGNRGYLPDVAIKIMNSDTREVLAETTSDAEGYFSCTIKDVPSINLSAKRTMYKMKELEMDRLVGEDKMFIKVELSKEPGYLFEVTLAEKKMGPGMPTDAVRNARIEVWNNTTRKPVLEIIDSENPEFDINFKKGNHYTILIRKPGYLSKRMEAYVDVDGCILCFEGVGKVQPGVTDNLTDENAAGVLLANVELEPIFEGKTLEIENIYYGLGKWNITRKAREQLKKVILLLEDNPNLKLELGSHTDSRGKSEFNRQLSEKRAKASVDYIVMNSDVSRDRVVSKGYGEQMILNKCVDGVKCSETEHGINRRTELKILGIGDITNYKSLAQMKMEEYLEQQVLNQTEVRVEAGEDAATVLAEVERRERERQATEDQYQAQPDLAVPAKATQEPAVDRIDRDMIEGDLTKGTGEAIEETSVEIAEQTEPVVDPVKPKASTAAVQAMTEEKKAAEFTLEDYKADPIPDVDADVESPRPRQTAGGGANSFLNGHKIVIHKGEMLPEDHEINKRHSGLELYFAEDSSIWYLIGGFKSREQAMDAHKSFLSKTYPDSYIVTFEAGEIK